MTRVEEMVELISKAQQGDPDAYAEIGNLRDHPEFKLAFTEKRGRIGPIYGQLHYVPGW